ncbi:hypothetical protein [Dictyobacter kobayashii]|uniref:DUF4126 domain-containing protein n=1 Tax=Dictyobacter kobayashii TaxID=2014872 RepID=A0A402AF30_9CHLR|nr:hypothetical protein [Dictyobacter kobayashii]GCE17684.1 hypothetical protein KDK_14840 [Dictyobacter kobayashii]
MSAIDRDTDTPYIVVNEPRFTLTSANAATAEALKKASWLGIAAGLRSMMPIAVMTETSSKSSPTQKKLATFLAVGEVIADKLPFTPGRVTKGPFIARIAIGAISGALLCKRLQQPPLAGAMRGALGAALGTTAGYAYRTFAANTTSTPDIVWALVEDGIAFTLAVNAATPENKA